MSILLSLRKTISRNIKNHSRLYAFGGGKGGIGKTFLSSNFGIYLARKGQRTLVVDLDLGGANAHTYLGIQPSGPNLKDYFNEKVESIKDVIVKTNTPNLYVIKGLDDWSSNIKMTDEQIQQMIVDLKNTGFDNIIFDLAAGTHKETVEIFLSCEEQIIITTPEPTSIENSYQFLKKAFHRTLIKASEKLHCDKEIAKLLTHKERFNIKTPAQLISFLEEREPHIGKVLKKHIYNISPRILINQARSYQDQLLSNSIGKICSQYFSMNCSGLGFVNYDSAVWQSLRALKPFQIEQVKSNTSSELTHVYNQILNIKSLHESAKLTI